LLLNLQEEGERRFIPPPGVVFEPVGFLRMGDAVGGGFRSHTDIGCYLIDLTDPVGRPVCVTAEQGCSTRARGHRILPAFICPPIAGGVHRCGLLLPGRRHLDPD